MGMERTKMLQKSRNRPGVGRIYMRVQNSFLDALMMPVLHTKVIMEGRKCNVSVHLFWIANHILPGKQNSTMACLCTTSEWNILEIVEDNIRRAGFTLPVDKGEG